MAGKVLYKYFFNYETKICTANMMIDSLRHELFKVGSVATELCTTILLTYGERFDR